MQYLDAASTIHAFLPLSSTFLFTASYSQSFKPTNCFFPALTQPVALHLLHVTCSIAFPSSCGLYCLMQPSGSFLRASPLPQLRRLFGCLFFRPRNYAPIQIDDALLRSAPLFKTIRLANLAIRCFDAILDAAGGLIRRLRIILLLPCPDSVGLQIGSAPFGSPSLLRRLVPVKWYCHTGCCAPRSQGSFSTGPASSSAFGLFLLPFGRPRARLERGSGSTSVSEERILRFLVGKADCGACDGEDKAAGAGAGDKAFAWDDGASSGNVDSSGGKVNLSTGCIVSSGEIDIALV